MGRPEGSQNVSKELKFAILQLKEANITHESIAQ